MQMATRLAPARAYLAVQRKTRLDRIVAATSHRMTISKLLDECAEMALPELERKYLGGRNPVHADHRRRKAV